MPNIFHNLQSGTLSADPGAAGTNLQSAAFANLPTIAAPDTLRLTLDPDGALGLPEIVLVTTHTAANTALTVTRGQETGFGGNAGLAHAIGTVWRCSVTRLDMEELPYRKIAAKGDILTGTGLKALAAVTAGANTTRLVADSAQAGGVRWAAETELNLVAAKGDLIAASGDNVVAALTVGANDTRLVADSTQATGLRYAPDTELKLVDAKGDLVVGSADNTVIRKAVGTDGAVLQADAASTGGVKWNNGSKWRRVAVQSIATGGAGANVSWDTEDFDDLNTTQVTTTITIGTTGGYSAAYFGHWSAAPGGGGLSLNVNGATAGFGTGAADAAFSSRGGGSLWLVAGDLVTLNASQVSGGNLNFTGTLRMTYLGG